MFPMGAELVVLVPLEFIPPMSGMGFMLSGAVFPICAFTVTGDAKARMANDSGSTIFLFYLRAAAPNCHPSQPTNSRNSAISRMFSELSGRGFRPGLYQQASMPY